MKTNRKLILITGILALMLATLSACQKSDEDILKSARIMAREQLKPILHDANSYEPLETRLDSAFAPKESAQAMLLASKVMVKKDALEKLLKKQELANEELGNCFVNGTKKQQDELNEAREKVARISGKVKFAEKTYYDLLGKLGEELKGERKYVGRKVVHSFKSRTKQGRMLKDEVVLYLNEDASKVERMYLMSGYKELMRIMEDAAK